MEHQSFELTPEQKGLLASLMDETGQPVPTLMAAIAAVLQEHEHELSSPPAPEVVPQETDKPIWELFAEAFNDVPEEEIARLPTDLAAQVDHYVYGLPKRPA